MVRQHTVRAPFMVGDCHFYSVELNGDLVLFDTGPPTDEAWRILSSEVDLDRLRHVFITHWHVDHCGQVNRVLQESNAVAYLAELDDLKVRHHAKRLQLLSGVLGECGFDDNFQKRLHAQVQRAGIFAELPQTYQVLERSSAPSQLGLEYVSCAGHSQSDMVFLFDDYAVTGDILLPDFFQSPLLEINLRTFAGRFDNYTAYCASLKKFRTLRNHRILPGHKRIGAKLDDIVHGYVDKLRERALLLNQFQDEMTVKEIVSTLCDNILDNPVVSYLKASEVIFMQDYLARPHLIEEVMHNFCSCEDMEKSQ